MSRNESKGKLNQIENRSTRKVDGGEMVLKVGGLGGALSRVEGFDREVEGSDESWDITRDDPDHGKSGGEWISGFAGEE